MTRPRATYEYGEQVVCEGPWRLEARGHSLELFNNGEHVWRCSTAYSTKQVFVSDDGRTGALDAADHLSFRAPDGRVIGQGSLLDAACPGWQHTAHAPVQVSTAGPEWEPYLAATFLPTAQSADFLISGRGVAPFTIDPASMARTTFDPNRLRDMLRGRAVDVLRGALEVLASTRPFGEHHGEPWRFAAIGWARVAGETDSQGAALTLRSLGCLELKVEGFKSLGWYTRPQDALDVRRYALDPLRQATQLALSRLRKEAPTVAVVQVARREGWCSTQWRAFDPTPDHHMQWHQIGVGISPSELVNRVGGPTHVGVSEGRICWSYDSHGPEGARSINVKWGKTGVEHIDVDAVVPAASIHGRVA